MFDYIYSDDSKKYKFYRLPQFLFTDVKFHSLSSDAKILYSLLLDKTGWSLKSGFVDDNGKVYVHFSQKLVCDKLNVGAQKAGKLMRELDTIGLIERKRVGQGNPDKIFVKTYFEDTDTAPDSNTSGALAKENMKTDGTSYRKADAQNSENQHSGSDVKCNSEYCISSCLNDENQVSETSEITALESAESSFPTYNTRLFSKTVLSDPIYPDYGRIDEMDSSSQQELVLRVREQIEEEAILSDYNSIKTGKPLYQKEDVEELVDIIASVYATTDSVKQINGCRIPTSEVKKRFQMLTEEHIMYVLDCLKETSTVIRKRRSYLLTSLYNAPVSYDSYIAAKVRSDMERMQQGGYHKTQSGYCSSETDWGSFIEEQNRRFAEEAKREFADPCLSAAG